MSSHICNHALLTPLSIYFLFHPLTSISALSILSHPYPAPFSHTHILLHSLTPISCSILSHPYPAPFSHTHILLHSLTPISCSILSHPYPAPFSHTHILLRPLTPFPVPSLHPCLSPICHMYLIPRCTTMRMP